MNGFKRGSAQLISSLREGLRNKKPCTLNCCFAVPWTRRGPKPENGLNVGGKSQFGGFEGFGFSTVPNSHRRFWRRRVGRGDVTRELHPEHGCHSFWVRTSAPSVVAHPRADGCECFKIQPQAAVPGALPLPNPAGVGPGRAFQPASSAVTWKGTWTESFGTFSSCISCCGSRGDLSLCNRAIDSAAPCGPCVTSKGALPELGGSGDRANGRALAGKLGRIPQVQPMPARASRVAWLCWIITSSVRTLPRGCPVLLGTSELGKWNCNPVEAAPCGSTSPRLESWWFRQLCI